MKKQTTSNPVDPFKQTLVIDDDEISIFILSKIAEKADFTHEIKVFSNPEFAIDYITIIDDEDSMPNVIFLDINMPLVNGWEVLEEIGAYIKPLKTKVFIATSSENSYDRIKAKANPLVTDFISKPITVQKMIALKRLYGSRTQ